MEAVKQYLLPVVTSAILTATGLALWQSSKRFVPKEKQRGTFKRFIGDREYIIHLPESLDSVYNVDHRVGVIFCFHGMYGTAHQFAYEATNWRGIGDHKHCIVVFPQAKGSYKNDWIAQDTHWEITDGKKGGEQDLLFVKAILDDLMLTYRIDDQRVYAVGFKNGALFALQVAVKYSLQFAAVCSYMGGILENRYLDPKLAKRKVPIILVTSTYDDMRPHVELAQKVFEESGFPVTLEVMPRGNDYDLEIEAKVWKFFDKNAMPF
jgi:poly(3-hydroxybutyrate) depolymerase